MWGEGDKDKSEVIMSRASGDSALVAFDERLVQAATADPLPTMVNVNQSSRVHIGPKFEIKNIAHTETVKDMSFHHYMRHLVKNSTRAERISFLVSMAALGLCITLVVYYTAFTRQAVQEEDVAPHEWYITREMWLATNFNTTTTTEAFEPLHLIIIAHSVSPECSLFANCASELRILQTYFIKTYGYDIPYNFLIGNDGRVYEGIGWGLVGAHTQGYNRCSLGVAFIGDYREGSSSYSKVTQLQLARLDMLLDMGIRMGHLHPKYDVVAARDLQDTLSPGENVYKNIKQLNNFSQGDLYKNKTCEEIEDYYNQKALSHF